MQKLTGQQCLKMKKLMHTVSFGIGYEPLSPTAHHFSRVTFDDGMRSRTRGSPFGIIFCTLLSVSSISIIHPSILVSILRREIGFGKGQDFGIFASTSHTRLGALIQHITSAKNIQHCQT